MKINYTPLELHPMFKDLNGISSLTEDTGLYTNRIVNVSNLVPVDMLGHLVTDCKYLNSSVLVPVLYAPPIEYMRENYSKLFESGYWLVGDISSTARNNYFYRGLLGLLDDNEKHIKSLYDTSDNKPLLFREVDILQILSQSSELNLQNIKSILDKFPNDYFNIAFIDNQGERYLEFLTKNNIIYFLPYISNKLNKIIVEDCKTRETFMLDVNAKSLLPSIEELIHLSNVITNITSLIVKSTQSTFLEIKFN